MLKTEIVYQRYSVSVVLVNVLNSFVSVLLKGYNVTYPVLSRLLHGLFPSSLVENREKFKTF
jgi:hypothetical protein